MDVLGHTARFIASVQNDSGAIPWFANGIVDPWDHVEAAMGLCVGGYHEQAAAAYHWLARLQRADGTWLAAYQEDVVVDGTRAETNFVAYIATGVWHQYLVTRDGRFLRTLWPTVKRALDFVTGLQAPSGEIYWAQDTRTGINKDALVTGCSSIYKSLECGLNIARELGTDPGTWHESRRNLGHAIRARPERFDRTWESKARYSMDWFYPVLAGVYQGQAAQHRIEAGWDRFVAGDLGCRCVEDQPWVTVAESCELSMACVGAGLVQAGNEMFDNLARYQAEDGAWWTGYAFEDQVMWPDERPTWTAGAVLLAADALGQITPAAALFTSVALAEPAHHAQRARAHQNLKQTRG
ncbi:MAG: prenyltransferase [Gammaproteobacteria bacterium]|nr:prenyltransferase [Gammaproteobacteria bacterium]